MKSRIKIAIIVPIVAAIVIIPMAYAGYFNPFIERYIPISVRDGYENVAYSGDFTHINSLSPFLFCTNQSVSTVVLANHPDSYLNVSLKSGGMYYIGASANTTTVSFYFSVSGHFVGLHPYLMTIFFGALGTNQYSVLFCPGGGLDKYQNVSPEYLGDFRLEGPGNVSVPVPLLNDNNIFPFYNFSLNFSTQIFVKLAPDSSHLFEMGAQVKGLSKPVISTMNMTIVETS